MICIRTCEAVYGIMDLYYRAIDMDFADLCGGAYRLSGLKFKKTSPMNNIENVANLANRK